MSIVQDYKKLGFSKALISLHSGKLLLDFGINIFSLFLPIFLFKTYGNINFVILYFIATSLGYFIAISFGARLMNIIGLKNSIFISIILRVFYFWVFFNFLKDPLLYSMLAVISVILIRSLFWLPFHTEAAELSEKKNRGKQFGIILSIASFLGIIAPMIGGLVMENYSFAVLAVIGLLFSFLSLIPFFFLPTLKEEYTWTFKETLQYFFHPFNRNMVTAYMSDGLANIVQLVFWPLFIFMLLDEKYQSVGYITAAIVLFGVILRLFIGQLLDKFKKTKLVKVGTILNSTAWLLKVVVVSTLQIFFVSIYHALAMIVLRTSLDTLFYEKAADRGHYVDEYTVIKEMAIHLGKVLGLLLIALLLLFFPLQISFIIAAIASLFIILLK